MVCGLHNLLMNVTKYKSRNEPKNLTLKHEIFYNWKQKQHQNELYSQLVCQSFNKDNKEYWKFVLWTCTKQFNLKIKMYYSRYI